MTDLEAIKQYRDLLSWWEVLYHQKEPRIFWDSPEIMAQREERRQRRMRKAEKTLRQAERALNSLPKREWKTAMIQRYILRRDHMEAADAMFVCERTERRYEYAAIKYLEAREALKRL